MLPDAFAVHRMNRRARIAIPSKRRDSAYFDNAVRVLKAIPGVAYVEASPLTGSVLILHSSPLDGIAGQAREHELFDLKERPRPRETLLQRASRRLQAADGRVTELSRGGVDLNGLIFAGFTGLSLVQLLRQRVWPPALTLLWYAYGLARKP